MTWSATPPKQKVYANFILNVYWPYCWKSDEVVKSKKDDLDMIVNEEHPEGSPITQQLSEVLKSAMVLLI